MKKIMRIGYLLENDVKMDIFVKAEYTDGRLSLSGVVGPLRNGNSLGGCGQIDMEFEHRNSNDDDERYSNPTKASSIKYAIGWDKNKWFDLLDVWKKWHLNDMQAGCEHQRVNWNTEEKIELKGKTKTAGWIREEEHPKGLLAKACEVCGYKYGTSWLKMEVPKQVIDFLESLPNSDKQPAWI